MTTEEINKLNENPGLDQVKKFIDTIEKDGYIITNFKTFRMQTEKLPVIIWNLFVFMKVYKNKNRYR